MLEVRKIKDLKIGFVFGGDYVSFPMGGTLFYIQDMLKYWNLGEVYLFGMGTKGMRKNTWNTIYIGNREYPLYPIYIHKNKKSEFVPERFKVVYNLFFHSKKICKMVDVLYFHAPELYIPIKTCENVKVIHMHGVHNPLKYSRFKIFRKKIFLDLYDRYIYYPSLINSDAVIPTTKDCVKLYNKVTGKNMKYYIPTCVDTELFYPEKNSGDRGKYVVLYTGRISKVKGLDLLVKSAVFLKDRNIEIHIRGDGEEKNNLIRLTKSLGVENIVRFYPFAPRNKLPAIYRYADVFVLPTLGEGFSMVKIEAMASGLPVIISNNATAEGVIDGYNGFILHRRDPKLLAELILKAIENKDFLGKNARLTAEKYYSAKVVTPQIENVILYAVTKDEKYLQKLTFKLD